MTNQYIMTQYWKQCQPNQAQARSKIILDIKQFLNHVTFY